MAVKIPEIKPIDIAKRLKQDKDTLVLLGQQVDYITNALHTIGLRYSFHYWDLKVTRWRLQLAVAQNSLEPRIKRHDPDLMGILKDKLEWLKGLIRCIDDFPLPYKEDIKVRSAIFFTTQDIEQGFIDTPAPMQSYEYEQVLSKELGILLRNMPSREDPDLMVRYYAGKQEERVFKVREELLARSTNDRLVQLNKQDADRYIDGKILSYREILGILRFNEQILNDIINSLPAGYERNTRILELNRLLAEIESKEEFVKNFRERTNIIP